MKKSFTLIEAIIIIFIFSVLISAVGSAVVFLYKTKSYTFQQSVAISEARKGIEWMVKEIREAVTGEDGSFAIEKAEDFELVFYSDIDKDKEIERVRYFLVPVGGKEGELIKECVSFTKGGSCSVTFSDFLENELEDAEIKVSVEGDLNSPNETIDIFGDGVYLGTLCTGSECGQCAGSYQDLTVFNVKDIAQDNSLEISALSSSKVDPFCDWMEENHSFKVRVEFLWEEKGLIEEKASFKKGVIDPTGFPPKYPKETEQFFTISENIMNEFRGEPIFYYYDSENNLLSPPIDLERVTYLRLKLIVNVNPNRPPDDFILISDVQLRNLKTNL